MPSWKIHEKWCKALGIKEEICKEVNKIINSIITKSSGTYLRKLSLVSKKLKKEVLFMLSGVLMQMMPRREE